MNKQLNSFRCAFRGIAQAVKTESHLRFHIVVMVAVISLGYLLTLSVSEWLCCIICFGLVITAELINTAIETTLDLLHPEQHPMVKRAKDIAAGAVLVTAIAAAIAGLVIFLPKGIVWLTNSL